MKILIATLGTYGDLNPLLALAEGLMSRGHQLGIATNRRFEPLVIASGATYYEIGPDLSPDYVDWNKTSVEEEFYRFQNIGKTDNINNTSSA